ncbi:MAG TPA: response regulator transcription factor [Actinospica sp.]|jgi:DNA-binding NarL/FixJ family response regulator|nr:response regulator transcription factor [Actinospica sp.]
MPRGPERPAAQEASERIDGLSKRESEVLHALAEGLTNGEIARRLVLSESTVKTHVVHVLSKLGARDRVHAVILAYQAGIVQVDG